MNEKIISLAKKEIKMSGYLKELLNTEMLNFSIDEDEYNYNFLISADDDITAAAIAEILVGFYKYKQISKLIKPKFNNEYLYSAYIGAMISIDIELERQQIAQDIPSGKWFNIDGIYNFYLDKIRKSWEALSYLSYRLYNQCSSEKDLYKLTMFMLGVEDDNFAVLSVEKQDNIVVLKNGQKLSMLNYFEKPECNAIATILANGPSEIIVKSNKSFTKEFMTVLQKIGV